MKTGRLAALIVMLCALVAETVSAQVAFQANTTDGCAPQGVVINVTSPTSGITSYLWQITTPSGNVLTATTATYIAILSQPGNYDVSLTINGNQISTINDYISVHALPTANFSSNDQTGCFPLCVDFSDLSVVGEGEIVEWSWDFGDGGSSSDQNPTYCYEEVGVFTPVFSVEDEFGCFADITLPGSISVTANFPNAAFTASDQINCNPPVDISFTNNSTGSSALNASWDFDDGQQATVAGTQGVTHTFNSTGTFNVCMTITDQIGCEDQLCSEVTIFDTATALFSISENMICEGESVTFSNTSTPAPLSIQWDFDGNGTVDSNNPTATHTFVQYGNYSPTLTIGYGGNCGDAFTSPDAIEVIEGIDVDFSGDTLQSCSFPFTVQFTNLTTGPGAITYEWFVNNVLVGTSTDLVYTFNSYDEFDIRLVGTNNSGCTHQLTKTNYVIVQEPQVEFDNGSSICTDQNVPVFNVQVTSVDPVAFYFWDFNGDGSTDAEGILPLFLYDAPGIYTITLTIETVTGCTASYTSTQNINVLVQVDAAFTSSTDTTCAGQPIEFCIENQPGNTYTWNFYDGSGWVVMPLSENCIIHDYADTGWYDLSLTVFNGACNVLQTFENFIYVQPPVALFEYQVVCGNMMAEFADISIGSDSIVWDFGDGTQLSNVPNPVHQYDTAGIYTVILTAYANGSDCPDVKSVEITVSDPQPVMQFTPESGCPPLVSEFSAEYAYPFWDVTVSNGDHITAQWNETYEEWNISYTSQGETEEYTSDNPEEISWPDVTFYTGGYYDVTATVTDENGCSATVIYDDAIHVAANPDFASFSTTTIDLCNTVNISFEPDLQNLASWQWVFSDGFVSTSENPFHEFNPPYNYNLPLSAMLTATDSLGCVSQVTQTVDVILPAVVDFVATSDPGCIGDIVHFINDSNGPTGTTYLWNFGDPSSPDNTSNLEEPSHVFSLNGSYEVCLSADNQAGCITTYCNNDAVHIMNPEVNFEFTPNINNCLFGVQFNNTTPGTLVSSEWNFGDDQGGVGLIAYHTYPIGVYDVTLTVVNSFGCIDSLVIPDILNYGNQVGTFTQLLDTANCAPFDIALGAYNPSDTYFDYFWDFNDGSGDPSGSTLTEHTYLSPGIYCPSVIMTDPNGCLVLISCTDSIVVEEFFMSYTVPEYICMGDTLAVEIGSATSFAWESMSEISQGATSNEFLLHPADDTQFILTGYYADCVRTDTIDIMVRDLPVVTLDVPLSMCFGDPALPLNTGLPATPPGIYSVNGIPSSIFDTTLPAGLTYQIEYTYTDSFLCVNKATVPLALHALPVLSLPEFPEVCEDGALLELGSATPVGGYYTYGGDTIQFIDPAVGMGEYVVSYHYTDNNGCYSQDSAILTIHPIPVPGLSFDTACLNTGLIVENQSTISQGFIASTVWDFGPGGSDNNFTPAPVIFPTHGTYSFSFTTTSGAGCDITMDTIADIRAVPVPMFSPDIACQNTAQLFTDLSSIVADSLVQWVWTTEEQTMITDGDLAYAFSGYGEIPMNLQVISNYGCRDSVTIPVQVRPAPQVVLSLNNGCLGIESIFSAEVTIPYGGIVSQIWDFGDGNPQETGTEVDNLYEALGDYSVTFTAASNMGCETIVNDTIFIHAIPQPDFAVDPDNICGGVPFQMIDLSAVEAPSSIAGWTWYIEGDFLSHEQNPTTALNQPGAFDITLHTISNHGCTGEITIDNAVVIYPSPVAGFTTETIATMRDPEIDILDESSEDVTYWYYDFGDQTGDTFEDGFHTYSEHGEYLITQYVSNTFGCRDTAYRSVEIRPELLVHIPNAFTPDANGHNEIFKPVIYGFEVSYYSLKIFNRWGILIFETNDPEAGWNGFYQDSIAEDGSYSWIMDIKNGADVEILRKFGKVILLR